MYVCMYVCSIMYVCSMYVCSMYVCIFMYEAFMYVCTWGERGGEPTSLSFFAVFQFHGSWTTSQPNVLLCRVSSSYPSVF